MSQCAKELSCISAPSATFRLIPKVTSIEFGGNLKDEDERGTRETEKREKFEEVGEMQEEKREKIANRDNLRLEITSITI